MERDLTLFPRDSIGDALWQMQQDGDDLSIPREIQFSVLFADKQQALKYGQLLLENNQKLSLCPFPEDETTPWEITAYPEVEASYENITAYQELLENSSAAFQGKYDGWYCIKKGG
ncbi:ribonuclease E inhibitor RraB [Thalassomonas viridans]|uniref:Ribonuclease E inhibitor RraB n=1 Tax=Thalassomonas viridans TaxID=137584 RepID=A0AAE9Z4J6_9GAMM|nr:ribonuclease E inhibitor RraB [Thalassomonas viridans]WDE06611.1 ribonuclease E inhibitor RraB [Thalassomonas viridans]